MLEPTQEEDRVAKQVVDSAFAVHTTLGPGLLESVYEQCLALELDLRGVPLRRQVQQAIFYKGEKLDAGLRLDLIVAQCVVVEVKAVDKLAPVHEAQLLTYMKLSGLRLGFLLNFNVPLMKDGIRRMIRPA